MIPTEPKPRQRVTRKARELRYDAGTPALNLIATVGRRLSRPIERLDTTDRLAEWFEGVGVPIVPGAVDEHLLTTVYGLREAAYDILSALIAGEQPPGDAVATVNACAAAVVPAPRLVVDDVTARVVWAPGERLSGEAAVALLARDLIEHLRDPRWHATLRTCSADDCGMIFLDSSQGGRRRWCSMETCGNRMKAAMHRTRYTAETQPS